MFYSSLLKGLNGYVSVTVLERGPLCANCSSLYSSGGNLLEGNGLLSPLSTMQLHNNIMMQSRFIMTDQ